VHIFWDQRSVGTIFDLGACIALGKKIKIMFMNWKTFANVMRWYEDEEVYEEERPRYKTMEKVPFDLASVEGPAF
jgi:hypothetical protein